MNPEQFAQKLRDLAEEVREAADTIQPIDAVPGETWVALNAAAEDLADLEREVWTGSIKVAS